MSDLYARELHVRIRDALSDAEAAGLRRHLGLGPGPAGPTATASLSVAYGDGGGGGDGGSGTEDDEYPLLGGRGPAHRIGGTLTADLAPDGTVTARQEPHPDDFHDVGVLLAWLAARADSPGPAVVVGTLRFHESSVAHPLTVTGGAVDWPT
ncbi:hypothetical protein LO771_14090 [Streptacidiphilus sp. ASG 303]|uniref:hypothetical protein n=1 Tax=Streptacidiphilus sp. ASG 303 TaxID=2896847 RepID=UPI001E3A87FA|nr:hypothetical protein [Streptacidiphilus sp. ASG 303]MCD0483500.1 hypothetical protein [Streptacidiphilus sp. ASG 303]